MKLTDKQLEAFEASFREDMNLGEGISLVAADDMADVCGELRELRALLATPMPCGWDEPFVTAPGPDGRVGVAAPQFLTDDWLPDEARAIGAALIRAALAAQGKETP